jgi:hypothetical protein
MMNHRESWAEERTAPTYEEWQKTLSGEDKPKRTRKPPKDEEQAAAPAPAPAKPKVILRRPGAS